MYFVSGIDVVLKLDIFCIGRMKRFLISYAKDAAVTKGISLYTSSITAIFALSPLRGSSSLITRQ